MYGVGHLNAARALMQSFASESGEDKPDIETLKRRVDEQNLVIQTLLVMLLDKGIITEREFNDWAKKVDQLDGVLDGKLAEDLTEVACPKCGRANRKTAVRCEHCRAELEPDLVPPVP